MLDTDTITSTFGELGLSMPLLQAIADVGYETPSPIQSGTIPPLLSGSDLLGQAQTGTGKTAAFALPLLQRIDAKSKTTQLLVLAPTRELALQVATAFEQYSKYLTGIQILSIYGGQGYDEQLRGLKRGVQVVIGTPGRVMDHIRRGTLVLDQLQTLVLDEADEMLRMGFIDDVEWILKHTPNQRQIALFSATMPSVIRKIANQYLRNPVTVKIASKTATANTIRQRLWTVRGMTKIMALVRLLELREHEGVLVFVRTKTATEEVAEQLTRQGFTATALNGDIAQNQRERVVERLRSGKLDIVVATDVVARGLDVERITHVINFDIPYDPESYIHRIGRTGRAGRSGDAILFVAPREKRLLEQIEKTTKSPIEKLELPSAKKINELRIQRLQQTLLESTENSDEFLPIVQQILNDSDISAENIAAAALSLFYKDKAFLLDEKEPKITEHEPRSRKESSKSSRGSSSATSEEGMQRYWIGVGQRDGVKASNIVGAIANEGGINSQYIGRIDISEHFSTVDLPVGLPRPVMDILKRAVICGQTLNIRPWTQELPGNGKKDKDSTAPRKRSYSRKSESDSKVKATRKKKRNDPK